jgi:hypothetical protein
MIGVGFPHYVRKTDVYQGRRGWGRAAGAARMGPGGGGGADGDGQRARRRAAVAPRMASRSARGRPIASMRWTGSVTPMSKG